MKKLLVLLALLFVWAAPAHAQGPVKICVQLDPTHFPNRCDPVSSANPFPTQLQSGTAVIGKFTTDLTTPGTTNLVSAGFAQQVPFTPTVQNAAYASGNCVGGFNAISVAVNNGQSGFLLNYRLLSLSGQTPSLTAYFFNANPSSSTCTDRGAFTLANADVDKLITPPQTLTLATSGTGSSVTWGSLSFSPPLPFTAGGSTSSGVSTVYIGLVSGSIFTPGSTTDIHANAGVALN